MVMSFDADRRRKPRQGAGELISVSLTSAPIFIIFYREKELTHVFDLSQHDEKLSCGEQGIVKIEQCLHTLQTPFNGHRAGKLSECQLQVIRPGPVVPRSQELPFMRPIQSIDSTAAQRAKKNATLVQTVKALCTAYAKPTKDIRRPLCDRQRSKKPPGFFGGLTIKTYKRVLCQFVDHVGPAGNLQSAGWQIVFERSSCALQREVKGFQKIEKTTLRGCEIFPFKKFWPNHLFHRRFEYNESTAQNRASQSSLLYSIMTKK